ELFRKLKDLKIIKVKKDDQYTLRLLKQNKESFFIFIKNKEEIDTVEIYIILFTGITTIISVKDE
ncbi:hypothetical protein OFM35_31815, partial [Escherichia coli]|nr:hypothetical protein [Escherichia coli]